MAKKRTSRAKAQSWHLPAFGIGCVILVVSVVAISMGGQVSFSSDKIEINGAVAGNANTGPATKPVQEAIASGEESRAANSLGTINRRTFPVSGSKPTAQQAVFTASQKAQAGGKRAEALNAAGDINLD